MKSTSVIALTAAALVSSAATASFAVYQQYEAWAFAVNNGINLPAGQPQTIITESFNAYSGAYANPLVGTTGPITWTANAFSFNAGIQPSLYANNGWLSTADTDNALTFTFDPGVYSVGGNFFSRNAAFELQPALVAVYFADSSSVQYVTSATGFSGITSFSVAISYISVQVYPVPAGVNYSAVDNLYFGVPAPGAVALLGVAGLVGGRRRR
jgi:hypothetical protein